MFRPSFHLPTILASLPRAALLATALFLPLMAMHSVQAGSTTVIEDTYKRSSGAGLVLVVSLQRS